MKAFGEFTSIMSALKGEEQASIGQPMVPSLVQVKKSLSEEDIFKLRVTG